jgi:hypothetical protein
VEEGQGILCTILIDGHTTSGYYPIYLGEFPFIVVHEMCFDGKRQLSCLKLDLNEIGPDPSFPKERLFHRKALLSSDIEIRIGE